MAVALGLAKRGLGRVAPNPAVGAVIVRPGTPPEIVARGWTQPGGRPHAETVALEHAGPSAEGATLYVTLEPCAHHGQTPPCADAIVAARVARVVCAIEDPDPRVRGEGLTRLRDAGIEVTVGPGAEAARQIALGHILRVGPTRPTVLLKLAVGSDGRMAPGTGAPVWVTGEEARAQGHLLRARADAILIGRGTLAADDPELTCRLPGMEDRSPIRVVLDSTLSMSPSARMLAADRPPVWVMCRADADTDKAGALEAKGAEIVRVPAGAEGGLDLQAVMANLAERGITRAMVEGGPTMARAFLDAGLIDEAVFFQGTAPAGEGGLYPFLSEGLDCVAKSGHFSIVAERAVGADRMTVYRRDE